MALSLQSTSPDLQSLQHELNSNPDDQEAIIPFVRNVDKFPNHEKSIALKMLRSHFFKDNGTGTYTFTEHFQLLTANNLSRVIFKLGNKQMEQHVFVNYNKKYLSHYPISDLFLLLTRHKFDSFAEFVFDQFRGKFLEQPLSTRLQYFELVSAKVCVDILKNKNIGRMLSNDELILITSKLKEYKMAKQGSMLPDNDTTFQDCTTLIDQIIKVVLQSTDKLSTGNLQSLLEHDLIPKMKDAKNIIAELLKREKQSTAVIPNFGAIEPDKLIGILSTDNFASFHSMMAPKVSQNSNNRNSPNRGGHAHLVLEGPVVMMVRDESKNQGNSSVIDYCISVQIQNLNQLFDVNRLGHKGSIYVVLLQRIPDTHEVVLSASNTYGDGQCKGIGMALSVVNPVAVIQWPIPQIEKSATFRIHAQLRPSGVPKSVKNGVKDLSLLNQLGLNEEQKDSDLLLGGRQQVAMMIFSGRRGNQGNGFNGNNNNNNERLQWVNVQISKKMTFGAMVDCACAQMGLDPPGPSGQNGGFGGWGQQSVVTRYVVRNQMGHRCDDKELVWKYWKRMMNDQQQIGTVFPVFVFTTAPPANNGQQGQGQPNPFNFGFGQ